MGTGGSEACPEHDVCQWSQTGENACETSLIGPGAALGNGRVASTDARTVKLAAPSPLTIHGSRTGVPSPLLRAVGMAASAQRPWNIPGPLARRPARPRVGPAQGPAQGTAQQGAEQSTLPPSTTAPARRVKRLRCENPLVRRGFFAPVSLDCPARRSTQAQYASQKP